MGALNERNGKQQKYYTFRRQFDEKRDMILGCAGGALNLAWHSVHGEEGEEGQGNEL